MKERGRSLNPNFASFVDEVFVIGRLPYFTTPNSFFYQAATNDIGTLVFVGVYRLFVDVREIGFQFDSQFFMKLSCMRIEFPQSLQMKFGSEVFDLILGHNLLASFAEVNHVTSFSFAPYAPGNVSRSQRWRVIGVPALPSFEVLSQAHTLLFYPVLVTS